MGGMKTLLLRGVCLSLTVGVLWADGAGPAQTTANLQCMAMPDMTQGRLCAAGGLSAQDKAVAAYLNGANVLGFFAVQPNGTYGRYLVVLQEGAGYAVAVADAKTGAVLGKTAVGEALAQDLQDILQEEIFNAAPVATGGFDGVVYTLGTRKDGRWLYGTAWMPQEGGILWMLGQVAQVADKDTPDVAALRQKVNAIKAAYVNDMRPQNNFSKTQAWLKAQADARAAQPVKP